jgi:hypothetical protein
MINRIMGVFKLSTATFEEIEHDSSATTQAFLVVLIVALLSAIGSGIGATMTQDGSFIPGSLGTLLWAFIGWLLWSFVSWLVGTKLFGGKATIDEMLRVIGFAQAPLLLGIIPCIGWLIGGIWALIAGFIAIRQGLDLDNMKALLTIIVGFIVYIIGMVVVGAITGIGLGILGM